MGVNYVGAIAGYIITSMLADNIGRRVTLLLCELLAVGGYGLTLLAPTLFVAEVGLFIAGFGVQSFFGVSFCLMS
jgi:MFS family permease